MHVSNACVALNPSFPTLHARGTVYPRIVHVLVLEIETTCRCWDSAETDGRRGSDVAVPLRVDRFHVSMRRPAPLWTLPPNPYVNHTQLGRGWWLGAVLVLPRLVVVIVTVLVSWMLAHLVLLGWDETQEKPLPKWRRVLRHPITWMIRINLFAVGLHRLREVGKLADRKEAPIKVANHQGFLDVFYLQYKVTGVGVSAAENGKQPLMGVIMRSMQAIMVERGDKKQGHAAVEKIQRIAEDDRWPSVCVFPEGNTSNGRQLCGFKHGAFLPGLPIQPITIQYDHHGVDPAWVEPLGYMPHVLALLLMCQWSNGVKITFLPVMKPSKEEKKDPNLFAERVRSAMAESMGVPKTEHSFEDTRLMFAAKKLGLVPAEAVMEMGKVYKQWGLTYRMCRLALEKYMVAAKKGTSRIGPKEFACAIGLDATYSADAKLLEIFDDFDQDKDGLLSFREFLAGLVPWANQQLEGEERISSAVEDIQKEILP